MKIEFSIFDKDFHCWRDVEGYIVNVAPHLSGTFAVHRSPWSPRRWNVSDVETGCAVGQYTYASRAMAVFKAEIFLRDKTEEMLQKRWQIALNHQAGCGRFEMPQREGTSE